MNDLTAFTKDSAFPPPIIVMGVCGSGKSTIGAMLAEAANVEFIDGDKLHPAENVAKMAAGTPLDDDDRRPWLRKVGEALGQAGSGRVIACSALKRQYRELIAQAAGRPVFFILLKGSKSILSERMKARAGHFMPPALLDSQLATLEPPHDDEFAIVVDGNDPIETVFEAARKSLAALMPH